MKHSKHVRGKKLKVNLEKGFNEIKKAIKSGKRKIKDAKKGNFSGPKVAYPFFDMKSVISDAISVVI